MQGTGLPFKVGAGTRQRCRDRQSRELAHHLPKNVLSRGLPVPLGCRRNAAVTGGLAREKCRKILRVSPVFCDAWRNGWWWTGLDSN